MCSFGHAAHLQKPSLFLPSDDFSVVFPAPTRSYALGPVDIGNRPVTGLVAGLHGPHFSAYANLHPVHLGALLAHAFGMTRAGRVLPEASADNGERELRD